METIDSAPNPNAHGHPVREVILDIATPKGPFRAQFPLSATIAEVIAIVVKEKKLDRKDSFDLVRDGVVLQPTERTLASFGLHDKVKLELVATGSGV